jgi:hypothetical protein
MRGAHLAMLVLSLGAWSAALLLALSAAGLLPGWLDSFAGLVGSCPHLAATGEPCPVCGTTRGLLALLGGDPIASLGANPLALGLVILGATQPIYRLVRTLSPGFAWREELAVDGLGLGWLGAVLLIA